MLAHLEDRSAVCAESLLIERANQHQTTVLIVDEAQNLEWAVLEEIRLLGNLETRRGKMLQIILSGQPELDTKLEQPQYRQLKQRIALRCHLRPFTERNRAIHCSRLGRAGMKEQTVFPPEVMREIHRRTQGIPRVINSVCDNLMLTAFAMASKHADARHDRRSVARPAPRLPRQQPDLDRRGYQRYPGTPAVA